MIDQLIECLSKAVRAHGALSWAILFFVRILYVYLFAKCFSDFLVKKTPFKICSNYF